jgi:hypothetical protein
VDGVKGENRLLAIGPSQAEARYRATLQARHPADGHTELPVSPGRLGRLLDIPTALTAKL